jgi:hypothetical protein
MLIMERSMKPSRVVGFLAVAALLSSIATASAKDPIKLTDGQLDKVTAGSTQTSANITAMLAATENVNVAADNLATAAINYYGALNSAAAVFINVAFTSPTTP